MRTTSFTLHLPQKQFPARENPTTTFFVYHDGIVSRQVADMLRYVFFLLVVACVAAWYGPQALKTPADHQRAESGKARSGSGASVRRTAARSGSTQTSSGRKVQLKKGRGGHYRADVRVNGRKFKMMVDTGASLIALTAKDAKRMGVYPNRDKFVYQTRTANGLARIAIVTLKNVKIGGIRVQNVKASVHQGKGLDTNLLGMSFLNRLRKFNFEGDTLTMVN